MYAVYVTPIAYLMLAQKRLLKYGILRITIHVDRQTLHNIMSIILLCDLNITIDGNWQFPLSTHNHKRVILLSPPLLPFSFTTVIIEKRKLLNLKFCDLYCKTIPYLLRIYSQIKCAHKRVYIFYCDSSRIFHDLVNLSFSLSLFPA